MRKLLLFIAVAAAFDCISLTTPSLTLEDCEDLYIPVRVYEPKEECSSNLHNKTMQQLSSDVPSLLLGETREQIKAEVMANVWSVCRAGIDADHGQLPDIHKSNLVELCIEHYHLNAQKDRYDVEFAKLQGEVEQQWKLLQNTTRDLGSIQQDMLALGSHLSNLRTLGAFYSTITSKMSTVSQCNAGLAKAYRALVTRNEDAEAEAALNSCNNLLDSSVRETIEASNAQYCSAPTRRMGMHHNVLTAHSQEFMLQCVQDTGWSSCGMLESCIGYSVEDPPLHWGLFAQVLSECRAAEIVIEKEVEIKAISQFLSNLRQVTLAIGIVAENTAYISSATSTCSAEAGEIYGLYQQNAQDLVKVAACQEIIAQEYKSVMEECLQARSIWIYVPFYNLAFINHLCTELFAKIIAIVVTVLCAYVLWCLLMYTCKATLCGKKNLDKIRRMEIEKLRARLDYLDRKYGGDIENSMGSRPTGNGYGRSKEGYGKDAEWPQS